MDRPILPTRSIPGLRVEGRVENLFDRPLAILRKEIEARFIDRSSQCISPDAVKTRFHFPMKP